MTSKGDFSTLKKCQAKLVSVRLNEKKSHTNPVFSFIEITFEKNALSYFDSP